MDAKMQPVGPDGKRPRREPPVFYPTMADMRGSFEKYIESIEEDLEEFGIGRIVPPAGWTPRQEGYDDIDFTVDHPIKQVSVRRPSKPRVLMRKATRFLFLPFASSTDPPAQPPAVTQHATGRKGLFRTLLVEQKPLSIKNDFKPAAMLKENLPSEAALKDTSVRSPTKKLHPPGGDTTRSHFFNLNVAPLSAVAARYRHATDPVTSTRTPRRSWSASFGRR